MTNSPRAQRLVRAVLVLALLALAACGAREEQGRPPPAAPPTEGTAPSGVPDVPDPDPRPSGANRFRGIENYTEAERAAWGDAEKGGEVALRVQDAGTGAALGECHYVGFCFAFTREDVDRRLPVEVSGGPPAGREDGLQVFQLAAGWWRLRVWVDDYRETWTPRFEVRAGERTEVVLPLLRLNRLCAEVFDPDGQPLSKGVLLIRSGDFKGTLTIRDGVGDTLLPLDELELQVPVGWDEMAGFRPRSWLLSLRYGETTDLTIHLERH